MKEAGTYRVLEPLTMRGSESITTFQPGMLLTVSQVDVKWKKVIGPAFPDWQHWDMPVERVKE